MTIAETVLIIGSGGREHALARAIAMDPQVVAVHVAPGNPGTAECATNHAVDPLDGAAVALLALQLSADLVVIGPEAPLVAGVADAVRQAGVACFGPSAAAARLEGSKAFAKEVMAAAGVATAESRVCDSPEQVAEALDAFGAPYVVKDDGLAGGKGVVVTDDRAEAVTHAAACGRVVIEEYLDGQEVSVFAITDGHSVRIMQPVQDFKRVGDGDTGPNTGGMGAYTPLPWAPSDLSEFVLNRIVRATVEEMEARQMPFRGLLYVGLALTSKGVKVVEFNARFGDPETQALLAQLRSPLGQLLYAAATKRLVDFGPLAWADGSAVATVIAARGYPDRPELGKPIELPPDTATAHVLQAGTTLDDAGVLRSSGGRVLSVVGTGDSLKEARQASYDHVARIVFPAGFHRSDIAERAAQGGATLEES